jgi:hypothetical protein
MIDQLTSRRLFHDRAVRGTEPPPHPRPEDMHRPDHPRRLVAAARYEMASPVGEGIARPDYRRARRDAASRG